MEEYQVQQEQKLVRELEAMKDELAPLEDCRKILAEQAERRTTNLTWLGLGLMSVQFGILARLTWWEYSWDIMEPGKNNCPRNITKWKNSRKCVIIILQIASIAVSK